MRKRVSKLSVPSRMRSQPDRSSTAFFGPRSATTPRTSTPELIERSLCSAATALGSALRASDSSNSVWRCRLRSEEHTSELQSRLHLVCRLLLEKKKKEDVI